VFFLPFNYHYLSGKWQHGKKNLLGTISRSMAEYLSALDTEIEVMKCDKHDPNKDNLDEAD
jgi:hypothetical protein